MNTYINAFWNRKSCILTNQNDVEALLGQGEGIGFSDAVGGAGDEGPFAAARLDVERPRQQPTVNQGEKAKGETTAEVDHGREADVLHSGAGQKVLCHFALKQWLTN